MSITRVLQNGWFQDDSRPTFWLSGKLFPQSFPLCGTLPLTIQLLVALGWRGLTLASLERPSLRQWVGDLTGTHFTEALLLPDGAGDDFKTKQNKKGIRSLKGENSIWLLSSSNFSSRTKEAFWRERKKVQTTETHGNHTPGIPLSGSQRSRNGAQVNYPATHCSYTGQLFQCPGHFQALHRETLNTTPMGNQGLEREEPNRKSHVQKRKCTYEEKSKESGVSSSMLKHLEKIKLLSICFIRAAKILQIFFSIFCLEQVII